MCIRDRVSTQSTGSSKNKNQMPSISPIILTLLVFSTYQFISAQCPCQGSAQLSPAYKIAWTIVEDIFSVNIDVNALAWVGFGWHSENADPNTEYGMINADTVVAVFSPNGQGTVVDYWSTNFVPPQPDTQLGGVNNILSYVATQDTIAKTSHVEFKRKLVTGDLKTDWNVTNSVRNVIWAYGTGQQFTYHGSFRGVKAINFFVSN
eukprot:TRINITY_DN13845_c0_g1_i1.p1 TRINITY_DN13845_c0_g1~~TRINITY_DN13845_c0_g1_i1.p1  ORF type:complete len:206 (-),score=42.83 TRINITY_DN13845_c0_g1_i1:137-754(-)